MVELAVYERFSGLRAARAGGAALRFGAVRAQRFRPTRRDRCGFPSRTQGMATSRGSARRSSGRHQRRRRRSGRTSPERGFCSFLRPSTAFPSLHHPHPLRQTEIWLRKYSSQRIPLPEFFGFNQRCHCACLGCEIAESAWNLRKFASELAAILRAVPDTSSPAQIRFHRGPTRLPWSKL